jgi:hypothetical protein
MTDETHLRDPGRVRGWKRALLGKGQDVARLLEEMLAGKEVDLGGVPLLAASDEEQRLRQFLDLIDRGIKRTGTDKYGRCAVCGDALAAAVLDEQPWSERCAAHPVV